MLSNLRWNISIDPLVQYSKSFNPCTDKNQNHSKNNYSNIEDLNRKIIYTLNFRKIDLQYKQCVLLVYLKLYYCEVRRGEFSAEVRQPLYLITRLKRESAFSKAYCEIVGENIFQKTFGPEYLDASMAVNFVENNPYLINNEIREVLNSINKLNASKK